MKKLNKADYKICVVGLGYVGLPLAARFSLKGFDVTGFDIKEERVNQLVNKIDINNDISKTNLERFVKNSKLTSNIDEIIERNIFIVTVPTPINDDKTPDLKPLIASSELVGTIMQKGSIVIYESTVYPGVTDEVCTPILERKSNLIFNEHFSTGYSPERIVPGDKINTIEKIQKVVSASNESALKIVSFLYKSIIDAGIHKASSIRVAEAAKVTENIQRDVNIALINEIHQLYSSMGISTTAVLDAASTKWNFIRLSPGLVGGHCIGIDPYYLMHKSKLTGFSPKLMSTARQINDGMSEWVISSFIDFLKERQICLKNKKVTIFGYSFKENCSDVRNTKVEDVALSLIKKGFNVDVWDPLIGDEDIKKIQCKGVRIFKETPVNPGIVMLCVPHKQILSFLENFEGVVFNYKDHN